MNIVNLFVQQDVFNQKYLNTYIRIGILLVVFSLALITSKDHSQVTPFLWLATMLVLAEPLLKRVWTKLRHNNFLDEDVLVLCALLMGIASGVYVENMSCSDIISSGWTYLNKGIRALFT